MKKKYIILYSIFVLVFIFSCVPKKDKENVLEITPNTAQPGDVIFISKKDSAFSLESNPEILIAEKQATIITVTSEGLLQVLVPKVKSGTVSISVLENKQNVGSVELKILEASSEQLLLELNPNGELKLVRRSDVSGEVVNKFATHNIQLNYDLIGQNDVVIFSGSISHPRKIGMEVFDDQEGTKIYRELNESQPVVFPIRIPKLKEAVSVRFYEADQGVDLTNQQGREKRVFLSEINLR